MEVVGAASADVRQPPYVLHPGRDDLVGPLLDPAGRLGPGRAAVRRVVLESAVARRVVRRSDHYAVGEPRGTAPVVGEDGVRHRRGGGVAVGGVDQHRHVIGGEHLDRGDPCGLGQRMGVGSEEQRTVRALLRPVLADGLTGRSDVVLVERRGRRRPAVTRGAERHPLVRLGRIGMQRVIRRHQPGHIGQVLLTGLLSGSFVRHLPTPPYRSVVAICPRISFPDGRRGPVAAPQYAPPRRRRTRRGPAHR